MNRTRKWIVGIVLTATAGFVAVQNGFTPGPNLVTPTPSITITVTITPTEIPSNSADDGQCAYVWASHDAPELTKKLDDAVKSINPAASARAELYGEDCVYADGHSTFGVMETDFHVRLPTDDLTNEDAMGNWMAQVLPIIAKIPNQEIQGKFGFVEFWFEKKNTEHVIVRVPPEKHFDESQGITGKELFRMYSGAP